MTDLLSRQGPLAHVWLAANYERKLSKQQLLNTNIVSSSEYISRPLQNNPITLRLSGQLLLGVVRIYSRKTKYLLDDVNDVLYKLKSSFKHVAATGPSATTVNLPPQQTVLSNINNIILNDQVTDFDLLYQEDLNLDESMADDLDRSVEFGRATSDYADVDILLDFDLDEADRSIEVGRRANPAANPDQSLVDINVKSAPLQTVDQIHTPAPAARPRNPIVGISDAGVVRTTKRKIVVDDASEVEGGISFDTLRDIQRAQMSGHQTVSLNLTLSEKLQLINELCAPSKRRRLWNIDTQLQAECQRLSEEEARREEDDWDNFDPDMDLSLPQLESDHEPEHSDEELEHSTDASIQVASHLRDAFNNLSAISFDQLIDKDTNGPTPLGVKGARHSARTEATRCFFEVLVLATNDCISVDQAAQGTDIGGTINVRPRDKLYSSFM